MYIHILLCVAVALVGLVMFYKGKSSDPKEVGRIMFFSGLLVFLFLFQKQHLPW